MRHVFWNDSILVMGESWHNFILFWKEAETDRRHQAGANESASYTAAILQRDPDENGELTINVISHSQLLLTCTAARTRIRHLKCTYTLPASCVLLIPPDNLGPACGRAMGGSPWC